MQSTVVLLPNILIYRCGGSIGLALTKVIRRTNFPFNFQLKYVASVKNLLPKQAVTLNLGWRDVKQL